VSNTGGQFPAGWPSGIVVDGGGDVVFGIFHSDPPSGVVVAEGGAVEQRVDCGLDLTGVVEGLKVPDTFNSPLYEKSREIRKA
jgi:hypothetical protein